MRQGFTIHHNGPNVGIRDGDSHTKCEAYWNGVKRYHVETKGWSDIAYSFGVCVHGRLFTGRGWDKPQFANGSDDVGVDDGKDSEWYTVLVFLGWNASSTNPVDEEPSVAMVEGVRSLISAGRDARRCGTRVLPHNAFKQKRCPGARFTELAGQWDHAPLDEPGDDLMGAAEDILEAIADVRGDLKRLATSATLDDKPAIERSVVERRVSATYHDVIELKAKLAALTSVVSQLGAGGSVDYSKVEAAAEKAVKDVLGSIDN